jgi:D-beta-D-heptose 7-phosphate kinase/D-beta-D-heptose 1-phosphate adenosyltransferase
MIELKDKNPRVMVIGDLMIDHYLWGECERISPEAPVQIVEVQKETMVLGGAGNVINNLKTMGARLRVVSVVGDDENAIHMRSLLDKYEDRLFVQAGRKTSKKSRLIAQKHQVVRFDNESKDDITKELENKILEYYKTAIIDVDIVLLSDYGKGVLTQRLTKEVIKIANANDKKVLVDPKGEDYAKYKGAYLITPNRKEASLATGLDAKKQLQEVAVKLKEDLELEYAVITLSEDGIAYYKDHLEIIPTVAREVYDVTGAGDTVLAAFGFALACGFDMGYAAKFANQAAAVAVGKLGSATVSIDEVIEYESSLNKSSGDEHIKSLGEIKQLCKNLKKRGKKIVFTNGCFDILHVGHVKYLEKAKENGDILIVGLNSDASVKRLKGEDRPVNGEYDRAYLLASLEVVDYVVIFEEDTPYELIKAVVPDLLVKGGDYKDKEVVGSDIAAEVMLVDFIDGKSTTAVIERIKGN